MNRPSLLSTDRLPLVLTLRFGSAMLFLLGTTSAVPTLMAQVDRTSAEEKHNVGNRTIVDDPVWLVVNAYEEASTQIRGAKTTQEERLRFYSEWRDRLLEIIKQNPQSRYVQSATVKVLGLCNGLGDSQTAEKLAEQLASQSDSPSESMRWHSEVAEACNSRYWDTKDTADAKRAVAHFNEAIKDFGKIPRAKVSPKESDRHVINLCMVAVLHSRGLGDHEQAASAFARARAQLTSSPAGPSLSGLNYDFEHVASSEMVEWISAKAPAKAESALESLAGRTAMRWPPSYYAHMFVSNCFPEGGNSFQTFVDKWLNREGEDPWTPFLRFYLAKDYFLHFL